MGNIVDYVRAHGDSFEQRPLCRVDSLVLCWLAFARIAEEVPEASTREGATLANVGGGRNLLGLVAPLHDARGTEDLLRACAASPRFSGVQACLAADEWSREAQAQFSALTFLLPGGGAYVAFRGTDDTLVGWKESFNMAFLAATPSQQAAVRYVERVAGDVPGPLWLGGHSKGGNLALYAASMCDALVRLRVEQVYVHDAPGFGAQTTAQAGWADVSALADCTVPEESLVGLLLEPAGPQPTVVRSTEQGVFQHAPLSWVVDGCDFAVRPGVTYDAHRNAKRLRAWLATMDGPQRERFVEILYKLASATGEVTLSGMIDSLGNGSLSLVARRMDGLPDADRAFFAEKVDDLAVTLLVGPAPVRAETPTERAAVAADRIDDAAARFNDAAARIDKLLGL